MTQVHLFEDSKPWVVSIIHFYMYKIHLVTKILNARQVMVLFYIVVLVFSQRDYDKFPYCPTALMQVFISGPFWKTSAVCMTLQCYCHGAYINKNLISSSHTSVVGSVL